MLSLKWLDAVPSLAGNYSYYEFMTVVVMSLPANSTRVRVTLLLANNISQTLPSTLTPRFFLPSDLFSEPSAEGVDLLYSLRRSPVREA